MQPPITVLLAALVMVSACGRATSTYYPKPAQLSLLNESDKPYQFGYDNNDGESKQSRQESKDSEGVVRGSYSYIDANGLQRLVEYIADKDGFRANVKTNEPGTLTSYPADAPFESVASPPLLSQKSNTMKKYGTC